MKLEYYSSLIPLNPSIAFVTQLSEPLLPTLRSHLAYSLITHFLNLPLTLSISLHLTLTLPHALNLPRNLALALILSLPLGLVLPLSLGLGLGLPLSLDLAQFASSVCIFDLHFQFASSIWNHKVCLAQFVSSV